MKISACLIVKNEAEMLAKTLPTISKCLDEIVIVDTGSTDQTIEVAKQFGAKVSSFKWINDYSAARNESLRQATGDWVFWVDADEFLQEADLQKLREIIEASKQTAYILPIYESKLGTCEQKSGYDRVKVFKNHLGYHFIRVINEQVVDQAGKIVSGEKVSIPIYHWGLDLAKEKMEQKRTRYLALYSAALAQQPDDPYLHLLLANNYSELKKYDQAIKHYGQAYELAPQSEIGIKGLEKKASLHFRLKDFSKAAQASDTLLKIDPENTQALLIAASFYLFAGKIDESIETSQKILARKINDKVANLYQTRGMPKMLLGKAYKIKGEPDKANVCFAQAREICPEIFGGNN